MKKLISVVLLFMVLFTVTACGNSIEEQNSDTESAQENSQEKMGWR